MQGYGMPEEAEANAQGDQMSRPSEAGPFTIAEGKAFISYASQNVAIANALCDALESAGISCWLAPRDVRPGDFYADAIVQALATCRVLILVLSQAAISSPHVMREVERASSKRLPIITFRTDTAPLTPGLEYFLSASQWLDASGGPAAHQFPKLIEAVRSQASSAPITGSDRRGTVWIQTKQTRKLVVFLALMVAVVLASLATSKLWLSQRAGEHASATITTPPATQAPVPQPLAAGAAFAPPPHSVAVLPFVNMSGDPKQEYFSDGISEELLNALSRLNDLQVVARTSSFSFKGQNVDVSTIAHKLNVGAVLEGSVRRAGNTVRITVQLINAVSGFHMFSQTYDRRLADILKVQSEIANLVAHQLDIRLVGVDEDKIEVGGTHNPAAYDAYLRSNQLYHYADMQEADFRSALNAVDQAISLDPNYSAAYALRANVLFDLTAVTRQRSDLRKLAYAAAERAVALAPNFGDAHLSLARIRCRGFLDFRGAAPEFDRALELAPGSIRVQRSVAAFQSDLRHFDAAIDAARHAVRLDPQFWGSYVTLAWVFEDAQRFDDAQRALQHADALKPGSHRVGGTLADLLLATGQTERARDHCESPNTPIDEDDRHACLARAYHALGRQEDAERQLEQFKMLDGDTSAYDYASVYAQWGNKPAALQWLAKAEQIRSPKLEALKVDWELDSIRNEPLFKAIELRMNFPP
jgi:TolB-like protein